MKNVVQATVLIVDDEEKLRGLLSRIVSLEGFEVKQADSIKQALSILEKTDIDLILCDVRLIDGNGISAIGRFKTLQPHSEIVMLTAFGTIQDGITAMKNGAFDYITKGDDNNRIIPLLYKAIEKSVLNKRVVQLEKQLGNKYAFETIIGNSTQIKTAIQMAQRVSITDTTVLLLGETGVGKEVFAQSIHHASARNKHSFVAINCSAFSKELLENELFGHKAGSFTGATKDQKGLLEEAHRGTLFLDEIGEMPMELQAKLLRVIETGEFLKIGDTRPTKIDVRILAATHRDFEHAIANQQFRADLFYRISTFQITIPSLRERKEDIAALAIHFAQHFGLKMNKQILKITPEAISMLQQQQWKGNIRELKNVIERSVIMTNSEIIAHTDLPFHPEKSNAISNEGAAHANSFELAEIEKHHIIRVLEHTNRNKTETARLLNIALTTLYRKLSEYGIS